MATRTHDLADRDLYAELGVDPAASTHDIHRRWRALAKRHHPDMGGNTAQFRRFCEAYECLTDPTARRRYDDERAKRAAQHTSTFLRPVTTPHGNRPGRTSGRPTTPAAPSPVPRCLPSATALRLALLAALAVGALHAMRSGSSVLGLRGTIPVEIDVAALWRTWAIGVTTVSLGGWLLAAGIAEHLLRWRRLSATTIAVIAAGVATGASTLVNPLLLLLGAVHIMRRRRVATPAGTSGRVVERVTR